MKIKEIREGTWIRRKGAWHGKLAITLQQGRLLYYDMPNNRVTNVTYNSSAHSRDDFEFYDIGAKARSIFYNELVKFIRVDNDLKQSNKRLDKLKEKKMNVKYEELEIMVVSNDGGHTQEFKNEEDALEFIAERLEASPRTKFKMLKPYQVIEPVKVDLSAMIRKVES